MSQCTINTLDIMVLGDTKGVTRKDKKMRPLNRRPVNKHASAKKFVSNVKRTKSANVLTNPMRGGIRL